jgi:hypothetical protein
MFGTPEVHRSAASFKNRQSAVADSVSYWSGIGLRTDSGCTYNSKVSREAFISGEVDGFLVSACRGCQFA